MEDTLINYFSTQSPQQNTIWSDKQDYIELGTALIAAAELKVDSMPKEGFDPKLFDEVLGLPEKGLHASIIMSLGYRDAVNALESAPKPRLPIDELYSRIK